MINDVFDNINKEIGFKLWYLNLNTPQIKNPNFLYIDGNYIQNNFL